MSRWDFAALIAALAIAVATGVMQIGGGDYFLFRDATLGVYGNGTYYVYYPEYVWWAISPLTLLPPYVALAVWNVFNVLCLAYTAHYFDVPFIVPLLTYPMLASIFYGNIKGVMALGLVFAHRGLAEERPLLFGIAPLFLLVNPQATVVALGYLWWQLPTWRDRLYAMLPSIFVMIACFAVYPAWLTDLLARIDNLEGVTDGTNITAWDDVGMWALLLWGVVFLPMCQRTRLIAILAVSALAMPFYNLTSLVLVLCLAPAWLAPLTLAGFGIIVAGWSGAQWIAIYPLAVIGWCIWQALQASQSSQEDALPA